jgi:hypothetical protein
MVDQKLVTNEVMLTKQSEMYRDVIVNEQADETLWL